MAAMRNLNNEFPCSHLNPVYHQITHPNRGETRIKTESSSKMPFIKGFKGFYERQGRNFSFYSFCFRASYF